MKKLFIFWLLAALIFWVSSQVSADEYEYPRLKVLVPGINTQGYEMLENAKKELRWDPECTVIIEEAESWRLKEIQELVQEATQKAFTRGKDVIVLVDMDLTHSVLRSHLTKPELAQLPVIGTKWFEAVKWAGSVINDVSSAFTASGGRGEKSCDAHSAGVDGVEQSLKLGKQRMFDQLNLFNGRTSVSEMVSFLSSAGYRWEQVNVFVNLGDLPAHLDSMSNFEAVKKEAGKHWTVYFCKEGAIPWTRHGYLIDNPDKVLSFGVYKGKDPYFVRASVRELKSGKAPELEIRLPLETPKHKKTEQYPPWWPPDKGLFGVTGKDPGGVLLITGNTYIADKTGSIKKIEEAALKSKPKKDAIAWQFEHQDKKYKAVALPFGKKDSKPEETTCYYDKQQNTVVFPHQDSVFVFRFHPVGPPYFQILQIAEGKIIVKTSDYFVFQITSIVFTDYPEEQR